MASDEIRTEKQPAEEGAALPPGYHRHADGTIHCHEHTGEGILTEEEHERLHGHHGHTHTHNHTQTTAVINRLSRAIGHLESVKTLVENGRDCTEVLIQLAAVRSALGSISRIVLKDHIEHCVVDAVETHDQEAIDALNHAIDHLFK